MLLITILDCLELLTGPKNIWYIQTISNTSSIQHWVPPTGLKYFFHHVPDLLQEPENRRESQEWHWKEDYLPLFNTLNLFRLQSFVLLKALCEVWLFKWVQALWWCWSAALSPAVPRKADSKKQFYRFYYILMSWCSMLDSAVPFYRCKTFRDLNFVE